jgi:serine/threonine protein phosphatase PrpC
MVADGLGHGDMAAEASRKAIQFFAATQDSEAITILKGAHTALRSTRGAAAAVAKFDDEKNQIAYCGVGNIATVSISPACHAKSMISHNGIVGFEARRFHEFDYPWEQNDVVIMNSDGLKSRWSLDQYPNLLRGSPTLTAAVLYRDFNRGTDDITVVVGKR